MNQHLPECVTRFFQAHKELVLGLTEECGSSGGDATALKFSMDGKLVGDIGEWIAIHHFDMVLEGTNRKGADGKIGDKNVEVKATIRGDGVAFRYLEPEHRSSLLLAFRISSDGRSFETVYNGAHEHAVADLYRRWDSGEVKKSTQCMVRLSALKSRQDELN